MTNPTQLTATAACGWNPAAMQAANRLNAKTMWKERANMNNIHVIFGKRGRTTIPLPMRKKLGWQAGDTMRFRLHGDKVVITREHAVKSRPKLLILLLGDGE